MQNPVNHAGRSGGEAVQAVYKILNGVRVQLRQADGPQPGPDMIFGVAAVGFTLTR